MSAAMPTPRTDAWLAALRAELEPRGARTALARHIADATGTKVLNWQNALARFFRGETRPSTEVMFIIQEWRDGRTDKKRGRAGKKVRDT